VSGWLFAKSKEGCLWLGKGDFFEGWSTCLDSLSWAEEKSRQKNKNKERDNDLKKNITNGEAGKGTDFS